MADRAVLIEFFIPSLFRALFDWNGTPDIGLIRKRAGIQYCMLRFLIGICLFIPYRIFLKILDFNWERSSAREEEIYLILYSYIFSHYCSFRIYFEN